MDDLLREFLTETNDSLAVLDVELVALEQNPDNPELLGNIFRLMHTIKGTCGFLDLPRLETLAHAGENVLGKLRDGVLEISPQAVTLVLEWHDRTREMLLVLEQSEREPEDDNEDLIARLDALAEGGTAAAAPLNEPAAATPRDPGLASQSIRVDLGLLDDLMTLVSELAVTRNQCLQQLAAEGDGPFSAPLRRLDRVVARLQDGVMKTRMQPIGTAWAKLPRIVRDLSLELGKEFELVMTGAETELDRQLIELIRDPLTHMVRNAADHGLEGPEERLAAGKSARGTIALKAWHEGGHIIVELADDGRGVAVDEIKRQVVAQGLAEAAELAGLTDRQIMQFIFQPGFSTAARVTAVSGRGVGMDVVRANIEKIGATMELSSRAGAGTRFLVRIPLTLAVVSALIVESGGQRFAIPQLAVAELVRVAPGAEYRVEQTDDAPLLRLREHLLPLVSLAELLRLPGRVGGYIVLCQAGACKFGVVVDRIVDTEEIVVKPVAPILRDLPLYSGNTILADGSVAMILDPHGIAAAMSAPERGRRILLVEDSPSFRNFLEPLLSGAGYRVTGVADAAAAMALCRAGQDYDAIVSDVETPVRGGFELAEMIRGGTRWRDTPMVALSARATPRDQVRGRLAGFDDHVVKSDRKALLGALEDMLSRARGTA